MRLAQMNFTGKRLFGKRVFCPCKWVVLVCLIALQTTATSGQNINRQLVNRLLVQLQKSKPDASRLPLLLELGKFHIYKPGESKIDLDSGRTYLKEAKKLSDSLHLLTWQHEVESMLVVADMEGGNKEVGRSQFSALISDCQRTGDKEGEAIARFRLAIWLRNVDPDYTNVFANFRQAAAIYKAVHKPEQEITALKEIAVTHLYQGDLAIAEPELLNVLNRYKAIQYPKLHYTYNLLSTIGRLKGDFNKGLLYGMLCLESMNKTADTTSAAAFYGDLARIYVEIGNHQKGIEWYKKSLAAWRQEGLPNFAMYYAAGVLAKDFIDQKKPHDALRLIQQLVRKIPTNTIIQKACVAQNLAYCYDALKNYSLAEQYYEETLGWYAKNKIFEASQQAHQDIGVFYFNQKQFKKADYHLHKALSFLPQKNALSTVRDVHLMLFKVDSAQGNYLSAINHFRRYKSLNDSLFNETKSRQIASLQIQYDTQKKEQNITLLTKQSRLQQSELEHAQTTRNGIIAGAILLAGLLGVSYNRYRLKQRSNQMLEAKQIEINQKNQSLEQVLGEKEELLAEKEWMLKEIHHRVKNNLQVISSLLNAQSDFLHDSTALAAIRESQNRVHAMALIHQKLYQSNNMAQVDMADYIRDIVDYLIDSFDRQHSIRGNVSVSVAPLDVTLATPLGLIINEAVTNSLKYAFPPGAYPPNSPGTLTISLTPVDQLSYLLTISDDGIGFPADFDVNKSNTLGLTMIKGLSRQIGGQLRIDGHDGVQIRLQFGIIKKAARTVWSST
ncbi:tetratricopeptide repeat-containing sensor histidine kinase [Spirosoma linguale]|uniref:Signal transduction histidine kinase n=1 Tax=Spirosoma linguale (strain ATCC 33905 / DSM 74 / LMG 10896 / Claus 1) TaxID=504472 RepID=D2QLL8_SPILD|nr:signal transduction histidine kinase [Spirosoma linguale DSM 74]